MTSPPGQDPTREALVAAEKVLTDMKARLVWSNDMAFRDRIDKALAAIQSALRNHGQGARRPNGETGHNETDGFIDGDPDKPSPIPGQAAEEGNALPHIVAHLRERAEHTFLHHPHSMVKEHAYLSNLADKISRGAFQASPRADTPQPAPEEAPAPAEIDEATIPLIVARAIARPRYRTFDELDEAWGEHPALRFNMDTAARSVIAMLQDNGLSIQPSAPTADTSGEGWREALELAQATIIKADNDFRRIASRYEGVMPDPMFVTVSNDIKGRLADIEDTRRAFCKRTDEALAVIRPLLSAVRPKDGGAPASGTKA